MVNGAFGQQRNADAFIYVLSCSHKRTVRINMALTIYWNIHTLEKTIKQRNLHQLCLSHGMKIIGDGNVDEHNIKIGSMIWTEYIRFIFIQHRFSPDEIKNQGGKQNKVSPDFFQYENLWKPFSARQQNSEQLEGKEKSKKRNKKKTNQAKALPKVKKTNP